MSGQFDITTRVNPEGSQSVQEQDWVKHKNLVWQITHDPLTPELQGEDPNLLRALLNLAPESLENVHDAEDLQNLSQALQEVLKSQTAEQTVAHGDAVREGPYQQATLAVDEFGTSPTDRLPRELLDLYDVAEKARKKHNVGKKINWESINNKLEYLRSLREQIVPEVALFESDDLQYIVNKAKEQLNEIEQGLDGLNRVQRFLFKLGLWVPDFVRESANALQLDVWSIVDELAAEAFERIVFGSVKVDFDDFNADRRVRLGKFMDRRMALYPERLKRFLQRACELNSGVCESEKQQESLGILDDFTD